MYAFRQFGDSFKPKSRCIRLKVADRWRDVETGIIEEGGAPIGMRHGGEPFAHAADRRWQCFDHWLGLLTIGAGRVHEVEEVLEDDGMVHRRQLEMPAIG